MAATALSAIAGPEGPIIRIIPTFGPPPPISSSSAPGGTPTSRSALPGSILSISHSSSGATSTTSTDSQSFPTSTPTASPSAPTDSQPPSSGTLPPDTSANPSATPTPSSSSGAATMTSQQSSSSTSSSPTVIAAASHHSNAGAIAGGVIGGLAVAILAVVVLVFLLHRRNKQKNQNETLPWSSGGLGRRRGEVRISSSSGLAGAGADNFTGGHGFSKRMSGVGYGAGVAASDPKQMFSDLSARHSTASNATVLGRHAPVPSASSHTHGYSQSNDEFGGAYSDDEEKNSTLQNHDSYSQHNKSLDFGDAGIPQLPMEPPSAYPFAAHDRQRSRSAGGQDPTFTLTGTPVVRSPSGSSVRDPFASPHDPKRTSGGTHRRPTQRKAVPKYDEAEFSMAPLSAPTSPTSPTSPPSQPASARPRPPRPPRAVPSAEALRPASGSPLGTPLPALNHKTSYGDMRPVHYLIPDLPPPQKE